MTNEIGLSYRRLYAKLETQPPQLLAPTSTGPTVADIKAALYHEQFRELFPELKDLIYKFLHNPGCSCQGELMQKLMSKPFKARVLQYFKPGDK